MTRPFSPGALRLASLPIATLGELSLKPPPVTLTVSRRDAQYTVPVRYSDLGYLL